VKIRYKITKQGTKKGYWRLIDVLTGEAIESGYKSKKAILDNAIQRNIAIGVDANEHRLDEYEI
jgi:hypothetical protein